MKFKERIEKRSEKEWVCERMVKAMIQFGHWDVLIITLFSSNRILCFSSLLFCGIFFSSSFTSFSFFLSLSLDPSFFLSPSFFFPMDHLLKESRWWGWTKEKKDDKQKRKKNEEWINRIFFHYNRKSMAVKQSWFFFFNSSSSFGIILFRNHPLLESFFFGIILFWNLLKSDHQKFQEE